MCDCRTDAQQAQVRPLLAAGRYEEAAELARELFEVCTESGMQVRGISNDDDNQHVIVVSIVVS